MRMLDKSEQYAFALILVVGLASPSSALSQSHTYVNALDRRHTISMETNPAGFIGGDRAIDAYSCGKADRFVCFSSEDFSFAVPNKKALDVGNWEYKGIKYKLVRREKTNLLGHSFTGWIIESIQKERKIQYLYSRHRGLLVFSVDVNNEHYTFLSQREFGFGAQTDWYASKKR
jgi:hypothetical protein